MSQEILINSTSREIRAALDQWDACHDDPPPDLSPWRKKLLEVLVADERFSVVP